MSTANNAWQYMMQIGEMRGPRDMACAYAADEGEQVDLDALRIELASRVIHEATDVAPWMDLVLRAHRDVVEGLSGPEARLLSHGAWDLLLTSKCPRTRALGAALERASWDV